MKDKPENDAGKSAAPHGRAAVIGLGSMGSGIALSLLRAGFDVCGCDANASAMERFAAQGGKSAATPAKAAKGADIVISVVVNAAQTEMILFGDNGLATAMPAGSVLISSATMDPELARGFAARLEIYGPALSRCADQRRRATGRGGSVDCARLWAA